MKQLASAVAFIAALTFASSAAAQDLKNSIIGLWKLTSHGNKVVSTGVVTHPYGQHPSGYQLFSKNGHQMFLMFGEGRKAPAGTVATDAERVALFRSMISYAGTYRIEGGKIAIHFEGNATPTTAPDRLYTAEFSGNKLTLTAEPFTNTTGQKVSSIRTFERVD